MTPTSTPSALVRGSFLGVLAALSFGVTTPLIQRFGAGVQPIPSAALLYTGAALASAPVFRNPNIREAPVRRAHLPRLVAIALVGALIAPALLTWGLQHTPATSASLLLNFEAVFTVLLARIFFHESLGGRVRIAVVLMLAGAAVVLGAGAWRDRAVGSGALLVILATFAWALDNVLTRPLADLDPTQVVLRKAALGATLGLLLSLALRQPVPNFARRIRIVGVRRHGIRPQFAPVSSRATADRGSPNELDLCDCAFRRSSHCMDLGRS